MSFNEPKIRRPGHRWNELTGRWDQLPKSKLSTIAYGKAKRKTESEILSAIELELEAGECDD